VGNPNPNYITPEGAKRLADELQQLRSIERPKTVREVTDAAAQGDRSENAEYIYGKKRLREIDRRMRYLTKRLTAAVVVAPTAQSGDRAFFGAIVEVEDEDGNTTRYQIVGEDEIDLSLGRVSWRSPIGRALLKKTAGDDIILRRPSGEVELTVISVSYPSPSL
jgi:transcription elongation factor GreB